MFIKEIELKNFKCFEESKFTFEKNFTAIIGDNGSGKTALLDGIATALRSWLSNTVKRYDFEINPEHIRFETKKNGSKKQRIIQHPSKVKLELNNIVNRNGLFNFGFYGVNLQTESDTLEFDISSNHTDTLENTLKGNKTAKLPLIAYYKTNRLFQLIKQKNKELDLYPIDTRFKPYQDCLNISINNNQIFEWIKRMTVIELQYKDKSPELDAVKTSMIQALQHLNPKKEIDIYFDFRGDDLIVSIDDEDFPFNTLSDGYKNTLGMVADIAYRMAELNPDITINSEGIVLIDELDLHLHPKWQRHIVNDLKTIFPNCQFIVTTHSPFIIQSLESGELLKLDETPEIEYDDFNQKSIEDIIENYQEIEMPQISEYKKEMYDAAKEYYQKLASLNLKLSEAEKQKLREELQLISKPYTSQVAYTAFLEQKRLVKETQIQK